MRDVRPGFSVERRRPRARPRGASAKDAQRLVSPTVNRWARSAPQRSLDWVALASPLCDLNHPWFPWFAGFVAFSLSFLAAMWLTAPATGPQEVAVLTTAIVPDAAGMMDAVKTAGLSWTSDVKGALESLSRVDGSHVAVSGWALDATGTDGQLTIIAFAAGHHASTVTTSGPRPDVAQIFGLSDAEALDAAFEATLTCESGQKLVFIALTRNHTYSQFRSRVCP